MALNIRRRDHPCHHRRLSIPKMPTDTPFRILLPFKDTCLSLTHDDDDDDGDDDDGGISYAKHNDTRSYTPAGNHRRLYRVPRTATAESDPGSASGHVVLPRHGYPRRCSGRATMRVHRLHTQLCQRLRDTAPPSRATGDAHDIDKRYGSVNQVHAEAYGDRRPAEAYCQREVAPLLDHR